MTSKWYGVCSTCQTNTAIGVVPDVDSTTNASWNFRPSDTGARSAAMQACHRLDACRSRPPSRRRVSTDGQGKVTDGAVHNAAASGLFDLANDLPVFAFHMSLAESSLRTVCPPSRSPKTGFGAKTTVTSTSVGNIGGRFRRIAPGSHGRSTLASNRLPANASKSSNNRHRKQRGGRSFSHARHPSQKAIAGDLRREFAELSTGTTIVQLSIGELARDRVRRHERAARCARCRSGGVVPPRRGRAPAAPGARSDAALRQAGRRSRHAHFGRAHTQTRVTRECLCDRIAYRLNLAKSHQGSRPVQMCSHHQAKQESPSCGLTKRGRS